MKSFFIESYGGLEVMKYGDIPEPVLTPGRILVQVKAVSINPVDYKIRQGDIRFITGSKFPKILGADFAGIVKDIPQNSITFKTGDKVYGYLPLYKRQPGALAEYAVVRPEQIRPVPGSLTLEEAAALPIAALTALSGLRKCGSIQGKKILVNGATGGVGHFAMQIARAWGGVITAVCSTRNIELAKKLGAAEIIDYNKENFIQSGKIFDIIFDAYGKLTFSEVTQTLKDKGVYATTLFTFSWIIPSLWQRLTGGKKIVAANMRSRPKDFIELEQLLASRLVKPYIEQTFPLPQSTEAFRILETGKARGKIIITI